MIQQLLIGSLILFSVVMLVSEEIKPIREWRGVHPDLALKDLSPENALITDSEQLKKIWQAWRPDDAIPVVDFQSDGILVATAHGPNQVLVNGLRIEEGDLQFTTGSSRMAGPGFGYLMLQIPRTGFNSVNGAPVPPAAKGKQVTAESIEVAVVGRVQSGVVAIGGETTGTTITANNITWELDLQGDEQLLEAVNNLGNSLARVTGKLTKKQGVEIRQRWIISVDRIVPLKESGPAGDGALRPRFIKIEILTTGGFAGVNEKLTINADGTVENLKQRRRITENWDLPLEKLNRLHELVASTDWSTIPAESREPNVADAFEYEFTIETADATHQFSMDGPSIEKHPIVKEVFSATKR